MGTTAPTYVGVDLAWKPSVNPTAVAALAGEGKQARLISLEPALPSLDEVVAWTLDHTRSDTLVAIDASLIVTNETGRRPCEREVARCFGGRGASTHSTNLTLYPDPAGPRMSGALQQRGFRHVRAVEQGPIRGRVMAEVYPHAAMVELFDLPYRIAYKKGRVSERRHGLARFRELLQSLEHADLPLVDSPVLRDLMEADLESLRGRALKAYEDALDAVFCAYLAFRLARQGAAGFRIFGDLDHGYIANPSGPLPSLSRS